MELRPGANKKSHSYFCCCCWNVNSLPTDNYCKFAALEAYNYIYKYDFQCVNETFLNSSFKSNDKDLMIEGYNLIQNDYESNNKNDGVYYKESLGVRIVSTTFVTEYQFEEITIESKKDMLLLCVYLLAKALLDLNPICLV